MRILVTGADGFIGRRVCTRLLESGHEVVAACRTGGRESPGTSITVIGAIEEYDAWHSVLKGIDVVVHLAGVTHSADLMSRSAAPRYTSVNVTASNALAAAARDTDVRRLVFMSSIKVNGECRSVAPGFSFDDPPAPQDNYGVSKWHAEQSLNAIANEGGLDITVLRPPLVYGPAMKGNLLALMTWIARRRMLPLASIGNRRSLIYVDNLADAVVCAVHTRAAGLQGFTLADIDISTPDLVRGMARALEVEPKMLACPPGLLETLGKLAGRQGVIKRLTGSLLVDATGAQKVLGWEPRMSFDQGMRETAAWYRSTLE